MSRRNPTDLADGGTGTTSDADSGSDTDGSDGSDQADSTSTTQSLPDDIQETAGGGGGSDTTDQPSEPPRGGLDPGAGGGGDSTGGTDTDGGDRPDPTPTDPAQEAPGAGDSPDGGGDTDPSGGDNGGGGGTDTTDQPSEPPRGGLDPGAGGGGNSTGGTDTDGGDRPDPTPTDPAQEAPGAGDSPEGGGGGQPTDDGTAGGDPDRYLRDDPRRDGSTARRDAVGERDPESAPQQADDPAANPGEPLTEREEEIVDQFVAEREGVGREDIAAVEQTGEDGVYQFEYTEAYAVEQFTQESDTYGADDIAGAERTDDGWEFEFTEEGQTTYLRETTDRASQSPSLGTDTLGTSGTRQSRLEDTTVRASESVSLGTSGLGTTQGDDTEALPPGAEQLERQTTSGVTPDYSTAAVNRVESEIEAQLKEAGVDPEDIDVNARLEDGEIRVGGEDVNDQAIRFPSAENTDTSLGRTFDAVTNPLLEPFGVDGAAVAGAAADEAGVGGERLETVLAESSEDYQDIVAEYREPGGEAVQQTTADFVLGPFATGAGAAGVADLAVAATDDRTGIDVEQRVEARSEDAFEGFASAGNVPQLALTAKDAAEYTGFASEEIGEGDADDVAEDLTNRAAVTGAQASLAFEENPGQVTAQLGGAVIGGAALGYGGSAAVGSSVRGALRGARSSTRGALDSATDAGSTAARRVGSRTPDVDVRRDPDAPRLELDPDLREQIGDRLDMPGLSRPSLDDLRGGARLTAARSRLSLSDVRSRGEFEVSQAARRVREDTETGVEQVRETGAAVAGTAREVPSTAARNVALQARRVRQRASSARARAEFRASQAADVARDPPRPSLSADTDLNIDESARAAGREFERRRQQTQLELGALRAGAGERLSTLGNNVLARRDLGDSAFRVRERVSNAATDLRVGNELALRSADGPSVDLDIGRPDIGSPVRDLSDAAFRTRERLQSRRVGAELAVRSAGFERPDIENPLGGLSDITVRIGSPGGDVDSDGYRAPGFDVDEVFDDLDDADAPNPVAGDTDIDAGGGGAGGQRIVTTQRFGDDTGDTSTDVDFTQRRAGRRGQAAAGLGGLAFGLGMDDTQTDLGGLDTGEAVNDLTAGAVDEVEPIAFDDQSVGVSTDLDGLGTGIGNDTTPIFDTGPVTDPTDDTDLGPVPYQPTSQRVGSPTDLGLVAGQTGTGSPRTPLPDINEEDDPFFGGRGFDSQRFENAIASPSEFLI